jgi:hypothetical protein
VPIIAPIKDRRFEVEEKSSFKAKYPAEFLGALLSTPELIRNVAVVGHLHHGKTLVRGRWPGEGVGGLVDVARCTARGIIRPAGACLRSERLQCARGWGLLRLDSRSAIRTGCLV